jgi:3-oxoacyl-[acyl-carrier protein] reductase
MFDNNRRVALLTGCVRANGIGSASARALAREGVKVVVSDVAMVGAAEGSARDGDARDGLENLVADIVQRGGEASWLSGDVRSEEDTKGLVDRTIKRYGRLDILVNNAAAPHGADRDEVDCIPLSAWDEVMAINARSVFLLSKAVLPHMRAQHWGRIINVASAIVGQPRRLRAVYNASKSAVVGFTQGLAVDVAEQGITVNAVCPGSVLTARADATARRSGFEDTAAAFFETAKSIPMGRHGVAEDIAGAIVFLASDRSTYLTGQMLVVDGGGIPQYTR